MTRVVALGAALLLGALLAAGGGEAKLVQSSKLHARVGPGFSISLTNDSGTRVTRLDPGTYEIESRTSRRTSSICGAQVSIEQLYR
jgi:glycine cleavage system pyridoxal-binding protein P